MTLSTQCPLLGFFSYVHGFYSPADQEAWRWLLYQTSVAGCYSIYHSSYMCALPFLISNGTHYLFYFVAGLEKFSAEMPQVARGLSRVAFKCHRITQDVWLIQGHEGKTKVFATLRQGKWNIHSLSLTLTLTAVLSPNHYTTSNFARPCTQFHLYAS